jgi:hypothetical protein
VYTDGLFEIGVHGMKIVICIQSVQAFYCGGIDFSNNGASHNRAVYAVDLLKY